MARRKESNGEGHNSVGMIDASALSSYVARVVKLHEERSELNESIKEVYEEAKEAGFVTKHLRQIVREKMMDADVLHDHLEAMDRLRHALGMLRDTPLGQAAERAQAEA